MTEKKVTKRENFTTIVKILREGGYENYANVIEYEIELLNRKNTQRKSYYTEKQYENVKIGEEVLNTIEQSHQYTITEIIKVMNIQGMSTPRMSSICNNLVKEGKMTKIVEKRKSYFSIA